MASIHVEYDVSRHVTLMFDAINLLGEYNPTQMQGNPYLIGPPGYTGGDRYYEKAYGSSYCAKCLYTLGNGTPTNNGTIPAVPWNYGTNGYVPEAYPMARTAIIRLRYQI
jgi:hypothetical protein